jgi:flagellar hook-associated protein 2
MPAFTSLGIGSGNDLNSLVNSLVSLERAPLTPLRQSAATLQTQVSAFGKLSSQLSALQTASQKLSGASLWGQSSAKSSDDTAVSVVGGANAATGNYAVQVTQLAANQTVASNSVGAAATDFVGSGSLDIFIGKWDAPMGSFTADASKPMVSLTVDATDTMATLRDKINGLAAGVTASIVTDATGARLSLRSTVSGEESGFRIQANDSDGNNTDGTGLSRFAFDPPSGNTSMSQRVRAANALATVNGIAISSASNEVAGAVEGISFTLRKVSTDPVNVAVNSDTDAIKAAVKSFVDSFNDLAKNITDQTKYDATTKTGGPLQGDSGANNLQRQLRALINSPSGASASYARLSDVGIQLTREGTLQINSAKLDSAISNLPELKKAFSNVDLGDATNNGFAKRYADMASQVLGVDGTITTRNEGLRKLISKNTEEQTKVNERADRVRERLVAQYTALDTRLARLNALSSSVTQQLSQFNRN